MQTGESTVKSLPKSWLRLSQLANVETQTDPFVDLDQMYVTEGELDNVRKILLDEITNLKSVKIPNSNITKTTISESLHEPVSPSVDSSFPSAFQESNASISNLASDSQSSNKSEKHSSIILFAGDSPRSNVHQKNK